MAKTAQLSVFAPVCF